jgi:hypothetical protein
LALPQISHRNGNGGTGGWRRGYQPPAETPDRHPYSDGTDGFPTAAPPGPGPQADHAAVPRSPAPVPRSTQPPQRVPGARRRHRHQHDPDGGVGGGRRRGGREHGPGRRGDLMARSCAQGTAGSSSARSCAASPTFRDESSVGTASWSMPSIFSTAYRRSESRWRAPSSCPCAAADAACDTDSRGRGAAFLGRVYRRFRSRWRRPRAPPRAQGGRRRRRRRRWFRCCWWRSWEVTGETSASRAIRCGRHAGGAGDQEGHSIADLRYGSCTCSTPTTRCRGAARHMGGLESIVVVVTADVELPHPHRCDRAGARGRHRTGPSRAHQDHRTCSSRPPTTHHRVARSSCPRSPTPTSVSWRSPPDRGSWRCFAMPGCKES